MLHEVEDTRRPKTSWIPEVGDAHKEGDIIFMRIADSIGEATLKLDESIDAIYSIVLANSPIVGRLVWSYRDRGFTPFVGRLGQ